MHRASSSIWTRIANFISFDDNHLTKTVNVLMRGVLLMVKAMDCGIVVSEFVLQSCYYVHYRVITRMERYDPPRYGLDSTTTVLLREWLWH